MVNGVKLARRQVEFFVSYAHKNQQLAESFVDELMDMLRPSKTYEYVK